MLSQHGWKEQCLCRMAFSAGHAALAAAIQTENVVQVAKSEVMPD